MKQCFVIMPIGSGEDYERCKDIYERMIKETVEDAGLELQCIRADEVSKPGAIIKDIMKRLYEADVVIADLSGLNANVCYELGVRHALKGGTIMIVDDGEGQKGAYPCLNIVSGAPTRASGLGLKSCARHRHALKPCYGSGFATARCSA